MCDGDVLTEPEHELGGFLQIVSNSNAIVKNVLILQTLILDWKIWNDAPLMVQELLWQALESLVRSSNRWASFNVLQFKRARVVDKLLLALQVVSSAAPFFYQSLDRVLTGYLFFTKFYSSEFDRKSWF